MDNPNLDGSDERDEYSRTEAYVELLTDARVLLCCSTSTPIRWTTDRVGWLHMPGADLTLLNTGRAPLAIGHQFDIESLVGVVERAWIEGPQLLAVARFGSTKYAKQAHALVRDRVLCNASLGFYGRIDEEPDYTGALRIAWWRPYEVSLVAVPRNWDARVLNMKVPLRVRALLADAAAAAAGGTPDTWRNWAASASTAVSAETGLDPAAFEVVLTQAVEAELRRLGAEAASAMNWATDYISAPNSAKVA